MNNIFLTYDYLFDNKWIKLYYNPIDKYDGIIISTTDKFNQILTNAPTRCSMKTLTFGYKLYPESEENAVYFTLYFGDATELKRGIGSFPLRQSFTDQ